MGPHLSWYVRAADTLAWIALTATLVALPLALLSVAARYV